MNKKLLCYLFVLLAFVLLTGCASTAQVNDADSDPLESYNRTMFDVNRAIDKAVVRPIAVGYEKITPEFVDIGVSNFFSNLDDVVVIVNDLLQFKLEQAVQDTVRFSMNSTIGLFGLIDIATPMGLEKNYEDFGQTLGYWGVGEGYYLVLPLLGPSTTRDMFRYPIDYYVFDPVSYVSPTRDRLLLLGTDLVDERAALLPADRALEEALDPYVFIREAYLQRRRNLVHDGNPPQSDDPDLEGLEDFIDQSEEDTAEAGTTPDQ
jgi:phospholipid-binding lipoprotein MlaA